MRNLTTKILDAFLIKTTIMLDIHIQWPEDKKLVGIKMNKLTNNLIIKEILNCNKEHQPSVNDIVHGFENKKSWGLILTG